MIGTGFSTYFIFSVDRPLCMVSLIKLIDETILYIIFFIWSYCALSLSSYFSECNFRYLFYKNSKIAQEKEQWRNLLDKLPLGVVVAKSGTISFTNEECMKIFGAESGLSVDLFQDIKEVDGTSTIKDLIYDEDLLRNSINKQFVLKNESQKLFFSMRHSAITFRGQEMTAIILQDQTPFEELKLLDEKYQRIYLASVVHDIRTPLNGILGMLEVIEQSAGYEAIKTFLDAAKNSAMLLLYFTFDITDYSQIKANTLSISTAPFSPFEVVKNCVQLLSFNFHRKGIIITTKFADNTPERIVSDKNRYAQILLNLLGNALKFTQRGEVKVLLAYSEENDSLITTVKDTGIGIKEENLPKLFKLFGKIKENNELNPTGTGLGLTICKKLTEYLGGVISVSSTYGEGSTFTFSISGNLKEAPQTLYSYDFPIAAVDERIEDSSLQNDSRNFLQIVHNWPSDRSGLSSERSLLRNVSRLLIVDDNDTNILVLQSFSNVLKVPCDIVS
eukprot:TRINITY_DN485_c0_g1_i2.p1 TRINITY_DN485_c0_g1~~TRINITY_DN485_c0_g1_i2.p1  ORF type:complete len:503 (+),score=49.97 TRINITY_DN485_c0_g1_i2:719-2227(+)